MAFRLLNGFIESEVVTTMMIEHLRKKLVAQNIVTVHTQAELGYGSSYKIPGTVTPTLYSYTGSPITPQAISATSTTIDISNYDFIPFYVNDVDANEVKAMNTAVVYSEEAGNAIATKIDAGIFTNLFSGATTTTSASLGVTSGGIILDTSTKILDYLEKFATTLRENNVDSDCVLTIPAFMYNAVVKYLGFNSGNQIISGTIVDGVLPNLFGCDIATSNQLPQGVAGGMLASEYAVLGGKRSAYHYIQGTTIAKSGSSEYNPAEWIQLGQCWGSGYSQPLAYYSGVVKKA